MARALVDPGIADFVQSLPKTETHLHIEGAVPWELLQETFPVEFDQTPEAWNPDFQYTNFTQFEHEVLLYAEKYYTSPERYHESAKRIFQRHLEQNVRYVETSFHLGILEKIGGSGSAIVEAIKSAVPEGLEVRLFLGMLRNHYRDHLIPILDEIHTWDGLDGIDMHGHETIPWAPWAVKKRPIRAFFDAGVTVTVSTDDPTVFANDLVHEYDLLMRHLHFSKQEVIQVVRNGFQVALVDDRIKQAWISELDQVALSL